MLIPYTLDIMLDMVNTKWQILFYIPGKDTFMSKVVEVYKPPKY